MLLFRSAIKILNLEHNDIIKLTQGRNINNYDIITIKNILDKYDISNWHIWNIKPWFNSSGEYKGWWIYVDERH